MGTSDPNRGFYAKYTTIVQSSGMGKSHAVDETSKFHFVIPVNLREPNSTGIPTYSFLRFPAMLNVLNSWTSSYRWSSTYLSHPEYNTVMLASFCRRTTVSEFHSGETYRVGSDKVSEAVKILSRIR